MVPGGDFAGEDANDKTDGDDDDIDEDDVFEIERVGQLKAVENENEEGETRGYDRGKRDSRSCKEDSGYQGEAWGYFPRSYRAVFFERVAAVFFDVRKVVNDVDTRRSGAESEKGEETELKKIGVEEFAIKEDSGEDG